MSIVVIIAIIIVILVVLMFLMSPKDATQMPAYIIVIRHGEKYMGQPINHLREKGKQRAQKLVNWVSENVPKLTGKQLSDVSAIYTPLPQPNGVDFRPRQTVELVSFTHNIPLYGTRYRYQTAQASHDILTTKDWAGKVVLVCWEHTCIQSLINELMKKLGKNVMIPYWSNHDFSTVYIINTSTGAVTRSCEDIFKSDPQKCKLSNKLVHQHCTT